MKDSRERPGWIAWSVTLVELALLLAFGFVLSQYWLMLPVWMRSSAGLCLGLALVAVGYRFLKFRRMRKRVVRGGESAMV